MKKMRVMAVAAATAIMLSGCGANGNLKKVAMEVGGVKITAGDVAIMINAEMAYSSTDFDTMKPRIAEQMETVFKYGALGKAMGIELTDEEKNQVKQMRAQYAASGGGYKAYSKYLKENASDINFLDELFEANTYASKVQEQVEKEFEDKEATDEELKKFYEKNYYCAKHILINKAEEGEEANDDEKQGEELAKDLLERAKNGEDFDAMMKEYSQDPGLESNPDGYVFTDGQMVEEFENAVKDAKPGEFVMCESSYGYHVILRVELPDFEGEKETVSSSYSTKRVENRIEELLEEYKITSKVNDDVIDAMKADMLTKAPETTEETTN